MKPLDNNITELLNYYLLISNITLPLINIFIFII